MYMCVHVPQSKRGCRLEMHVYTYSGEAAEESIAICLSHAFLERFFFFGCSRSTVWLERWVVRGRRKCFSKDWVRIDYAWGHLFLMRK